MKSSSINQADLQRIHKELCLTVPLKQVSPTVIMVLKIVAHHRKSKALKPVKKSPLAPTFSKQYK